MLSAFRSSAIIFQLLFLIHLTSASEFDHTYQADDPITLWVNKVGPYNNPQETYSYYSLPSCQPRSNQLTRGEVWVKLFVAMKSLTVKLTSDIKGTICQLELDATKVKHFKDAIENAYWFEFFIGFVGELHPDKSNEHRHLLYAHKNIMIKYNGEQIIPVNLTQESPRPLEAGKTFDLTYLVKWVPTNITFAQRFDVYSDYPFFEHQIRWFSIFNSFMMVIFLTGLVSMKLMRRLRNDYAKYAREYDDLKTLERDVNKESGWKLVHGDVFRPPRNLVFLVIVLAIFEKLYIRRGIIVTTFIFVYTVTSFISGYVSGRLYPRNVDGYNQQQQNAEQFVSEQTLLGRETFRSGPLTTVGGNATKVEGKDREETASEAMNRRRRENFPCCLLLFALGIVMALPFLQP